MTRKKAWKIVGWSMLALLLVVVVAGGLLFRFVKRHEPKPQPVPTDLNLTGVGEHLFNVPYGENPFQRFDVFLPEKLDPSRPNGIVLHIHGGSWMMGTKNWHAGACTDLARKGFAAATMDYRLAFLTNLVKVQDMLDDIAAAIARLKALSDERGWNLQRVALYGQSAGAHLALLFAYTEAGRNAALPIAFVVDEVGPIDFHYENWRSFQPKYSDRFLCSVLSMLIRRPVTVKRYQLGEYEEKIRAISPLFQVSPQSPPTILMYGAKDEIQNPQNGQILSEALTKANVPNELFMLPNSGHDANWQLDEMTIRQVFQAYERYLKTYFPK